MKKLSALILACAMAATASAVLIDDFSGDLSAYTPTVILDTDPGGGANTSTWQIASETLELDTTMYQSIEQHAMIYNGLSLAVGEELQVDLVHNGASQDLGLYVGGTTPTYNVRFDYISMYARHTGEIFTRGFDGGSEYGQVGWITPPYEKLFIARTDVNTFEAGWYEAGGVRNVLVTRTPAYPNAATVCGFYADVRALGTLGHFDNLTVIPEPTTALLLSLGGLALLRRRA